MRMLVFAYFRESTAQRRSVVAAYSSFPGRFAREVLNIQKVGRTPQAARDVKVQRHMGERWAHYY
eukprot:7363478-Pyramimonas_sp.AAC.1